MTDHKFYRDLRGGEQGWFWVLQIRLEFDARSESFGSWKEFRKWLFDPEINFQTETEVFAPQRAKVAIFWPNLALRVFGFDFAVGLCVRPPIDIEELSND